MWRRYVCARVGRRVQGRDSRGLRRGHRVLGGLKSMGKVLGGPQTLLKAHPVLGTPKALGEGHELPSTPQAVGRPRAGPRGPRGLWEGSRRSSRQRSAPSGCRARRARGGRSAWPCPRSCRTWAGSAGGCRPPSPSPSAAGRGHPVGWPHGLRGSVGWGHPADPDPWAPPTHGVGGALWGESPMV